MNTINLEIENLDLQYFINNSNATCFGELREYIQDNGGFNVEIIYYSKAIEYLAQNDSSLKHAFELAKDYGFELENLNSEILASLVASANLTEEFDSYENEINEYFESLNEETED